MTTAITPKRAAARSSASSRRPTSSCRRDFSTSSRTVMATTHEDGTVRVWDGADGKSRASYRGHDRVVLAAAVSPDGKLVATAGGDGWGVAQTLTARGVLTHAAHVVDGKVASYRVQAPTDGFFADAAPLSSLLGNLEFASLDQARQVLNQAILALDPCLPYEVELHDA